MKHSQTLVLLLLFIGANMINGCGGGSGGSGLNLPAIPASEEKLRRRVMATITDALDSEEPVMRCHGLELLGLMKDKSTYHYIRQSLTDQAVAAVFAGAVAAGDVRDYQCRNQLEKLLKNDNVSIKLAAGYGLERLGDGRFVRWYDEALLGADAQSASQACMMLGKLGNTARRKDSKKKLWEVLRKRGQKAIVRLQAAEALARLGDQNVTEKLLVYAGSGYADDRLIAVSGLELLKNSESLAMMEVLADDAQIEVQLAALRALGPMCGAREMETAYRHLHYRDSGGDEIAASRVRHLALLAVGSFGRHKDGNLLYRALGARSLFTRIYAARATLDYLEVREAKKQAEAEMF